MFLRSSQAMGCRFSKKNVPSSSSSSVSVAKGCLSSGSECLQGTSITKKPAVKEPEKAGTEKKIKKSPAGEEDDSGGKEIVKKEIPDVGHGKTEAMVISAAASSSSVSGVEKLGNAAVVRTSSCTREEVDAILIQCGRLSRSDYSSSGGGGSGGGSKTATRRYSGSKRNFDFDQRDNQTQNVSSSDGAVGRFDFPRKIEEYLSSPRGGRRRRTPGREKEEGTAQGSGGRRVSRSPGRRAEAAVGGEATVGGGGARPGKKMVSVPATVISSSLVVTEKSGNHGGDVVSAVDTRRVGGARVAAPPRRSPSPARARGENQNQLCSRKAERSPCKRKPLGEIDQNLMDSDKIRYATTPKKRVNQKPNLGEKQLQVNANITATPVACSISEKVKPQTITRSRPLRRSRDLDTDPEFSVSNPRFSSHTEKTSPVVSGGLFEAHPFLEREMMVKDDLVEPSLHKYVTVRRGSSLDHDEIEEQESFGSISFLRSQGISSSCEPSSADSIDPRSIESNRGSRSICKRNRDGRGRIGVGKGF